MSFLNRMEMGREGAMMTLTRRDQAAPSSDQAAMCFNEGFKSFSNAAVAIAGVELAHPSMSINFRSDVDLSHWSRA
jgi:hypothetical protein